MTLTTEHTWSSDVLATALPWLVDRSGYAATSHAAAHAVGSVDAAVTAAAAALDIEVTPIDCALDRIGDCLASLAPMLVRLADGTALYVASATRRRVVAITPDGGRVRLSVADVARALVEPSAEGMQDPLDALTDALGRRSKRIAAALRGQRGRDRPLFLGWTLEPTRATQPTQAAFGARHCVPLLATHLLQFALWIASWALLVAVLSDVGERAHLLVLWIAALASALALLPVESSLEQSLAARVGIAVKRRLFAAALDADKRQVGRLGLGRMIAQSLETHHLDSMAARGGVRVVLATFDLVVVFVAYGVAIGVDALFVLFALVAALAAFYVHRYYAQARRFLADNLDVTGVHTELLVGHRTRKAFVAVQRWNAEEDRSLARYHEAGRRFDSAYLRIAAIPRLWTLLALVVVMTTLYRSYGDQLGIASVAMIGFVIAMTASLQSIVTGISEAIRSRLSFAAIDTLEPDPALDAQRGIGVVGDGDFVCRGVSYAYPGALQPVLAAVDLDIAAHQRLLLTGRSGSGKSTLAAIMAGRIQQDAGVVLSGGVDRHVAGMRQWRRSVCYVPQAGTNHVLTETFAFNLLLGRSWPPSRADLDDAWTVARMLGLDALIERMPAGMMQMVGEGGWSLSQGEKARLFIGRGILQRARLLIADEVLSPLDAGNALKTLDALERHDGRLMLIAHV